MHVPLAALPCLGLVLPGDESAVAHPVGALLLRILPPPAVGPDDGLAPGGGGRGTGRMAPAPMLVPALFRVVVYGTAGILLECWDGLPAEASSHLGRHPVLKQACWKCE